MNKPNSCSHWVEITSPGTMPFSPSGAESRFAVDPPCLIKIKALSPFRRYQSAVSFVDEVTEQQKKLLVQGCAIPKQGLPTFASF
jgi:hypothetical protein